ncbi:MAG: SDR family NAD(P)-dependent oxidoreductase [Pseudomonadales bacterium]
MRLENRVAVVTGGASGMGKATVLRFLAEGARVVIADFNAATGADTVREASAAGFSEQVRFIKTDVAEESDVAAAVFCAVETFGGIDVMFNNAGVGGAIGPLTETSVSDWDYTFAVLTRGVFLGIKHAARAMRAQGRGGSIINTASIAGMSGDAGPLAYSAAKAAVINLSKGAAVELAQDHIRVNAICPGFIATPLAALGGSVAELYAQFATAHPWPEAGNGDHIAGVALFLASDDARFVTGESILVDGGLTASGPELSRKFPRTAGRQSRYAGITRGSTGEPSALRKLDT